MGNHIEVEGCSTPSRHTNLRDYSFVRECRHGKIMRDNSTNQILIVREILAADDTSHMKLLSRLRTEKPYTNVANLLHF